MGILHLVADYAYSADVPQRRGADALIEALLGLIALLVWLILTYSIIRGAVLSALRAHWQETRQDRRPVAQYVQAPAPQPAPPPQPIQPRYSVPSPLGQRYAAPAREQAFVVDDTGE